MSGLNYNHLRYFWVVAREGHLTRAAERLNVSQSALSSQIKKLEGQLGHPLFERRGRRLYLTEAGQVALDYADAIFETGEELLGTMQRTGRSIRHTLRVGALATLSRNFQLRFLSPVLAKDDIDLVLRSGSLTELMAALEAHRLDVVLVNQVPLRDADSGWTAHVVDQQPVSLVGARGRIGDGANLTDLLATHPLIVPTAASGVRSGFDALVMRLGLTPRIAIEVDDMAMMRVLVSHDIGLGVLPPIVVRDELDSGALIEAARLPDITETFSAIFLQRRFPNPLIHRLIGRTD